MKNLLQKTALGFCVFAVLTVNAQIKSVNDIKSFKAEKPSALKKVDAKPTGGLKARNGENLKDEFSENKCKKNTPILPSAESVMGAVIFSEDFGGGSIPMSWQNIDVKGSGKVWEWTKGASKGGAPGELDAGSANSTSGNGYVMFDSDGSNTSIGGEESDLITPPINCIGKTIIHLKFNEYFRQWLDSKGKVFVSNNGTTWTLFHSADSGLVQNQGTPNPSKVDIDISSVAANKANVFIKFKYTGDYDYYWFLDDISVEEVVPYDGRIFAVTSPASVCTFSNLTPVSIIVKNEGSAVMSGFDVGFSLDGGPMVVESPGTPPINPGDTVTVPFQATVDLAGATSHTLSFEILWPQDMAQGNNKTDISIKEYLKDITVSPLVDGFNSSADIEGWTILNNDSGNRSFELSQGSMVLSIYQTIASNDWLISPCVYLEAEKDYALSFDYVTSGKTHKLRISYGDTPDSSGQNKILDDLTALNNTTTIKYIKIFQPTVSSIYYIGIWDYSDGATTTPTPIYIDNFALLQMGSAEAGISKILSPVSTCNLTSSDTVIITIDNLGVNEITGFDVSYTINGGSPVTENIGTFSISAGSSADYSFTALADLSTFKEATIHASLTLPGDINNFNDTASIKIKELQTDLSTDTLMEEFNAASGFPEGWEIQDNLNTDTTWYFSAYSGGTMIIQTTKDETADDWLFSQCIYMEAGTFYDIGFSYKDYNNTLHRLALSLFIGQSDMASETKLLNEFEVYSGTDFKDTSVFYQAISSGYFYIGIHCLGGSSLSYLIIDNVKAIKLNEKDLAVTGIKAPIDGTCEFSNTENITVTIKNNGITNINTFNISYKIDGGAPVTETVNQAITLGSTYNYTFPTKADLSAKGNHTISVYGNLSGDNNQKNDTIKTMVNETITIISPDSIFEEFSNGIPLGWSVQNYDNPGTASWYSSGFGGGNNAIFFETSGTGSADDWLFSSCVYLEKDINYIAEFKYWNALVDTTHTISLQIATSPDKSTATSKLGPFPFANGTGDIGIGNIKDTTTTPFTVSSSGIYYIAIVCHGSSAPNKVMAIDEFELYKTAALDLGIAGAVSPKTGSCLFTTDETVAVSVINEGLDSLTDFTLTYIIDGVDTISEPMTEPLAPGTDAVEISFAVVANLSVPGTHVIKVYATLVGDENPLNDTIVYTVYSIHKDLETEEIHNNFETAEERAGWKSEMSGQYPLWFLASSPTIDNSSNSIAFVADTGKAPNAWYFSPCINVDSANTYAISFYYTDNVSSSEKFNLKIAMGDAPDATKMLEQITDGPVSSTSDYTKVTYSFKPANPGDYYIGIQVYGISDSVIRYISIENIYLYKLVPPTAMFSSTISQFNSLAVNFNDESLGGVTSWLWDFGDGLPTDTLQNPEHVFPDSTKATYQICLTVTNSMGNDTHCDTLTVFGPVSINDKLPVTNELAYYPIPANSILTVKFKGKNPAVKSIRILNMVGQVIHSAIVTNTSTYNLNTSDLPAGFYYLQIITDKEVINKKLMINR